MPELVDHANRIEVRSPMRTGARVGFACLGVFPLVAPYELLVRIDWQEYLQPFFLLAAFLSAGAAALSAFLFFAAVAGLSSRMVFDGARSTFTYSAEAPLIRRATSVYPMSAINRIDVRVREWSDGPPVYHLRVAITDGTVFESTSSWSSDEVELVKRRIDQFLSGILGS